MQRIMEPVTNNNNIFISAFLGVILLIAAIGFTLANYSHIAMMELSSSAIVAGLSFSSFSLLFKAIKEDKHRLKASN